MIMRAPKRKGILAQNKIGIICGCKAKKLVKMKKATNFVTDEVECFEDKMFMLMSNSIKKSLIINWNFGHACNKTKWSFEKKKQDFF